MNWTPWKKRSSEIASQTSQVIEEIPSIPSKPETQEPLRKFRLDTLPNDGEGTEIRELQAKASTLLGYKGMDCRVILATVLTELGIEILDWREVDRYKEQQRKKSKNLEWSWTPIEKYNDPIPEFVLRKAVQIKERVPAAEFRIVHLGDQDPFLRVDLGGRGYYIEVWDEPEFESKYL